MTPSGEKIAGFFSKVISVLPVSRAAVNEMQDRLLVAESDLTTCNTLVWSAAAGMMTAVVMAGVLVWVRARIMDKRHSVKLAHIKSEIARARAQIETTRSARLHLQRVSTKDRAKIAQAKKDLECQGKNTASIQAEFELVSSKVLQLQLAMDKKKEEEANAIAQGNALRKKSAQAAADLKRLREKVEDLKRANDILRRLIVKVAEDKNVGQLKPRQ